MARISDKKNLSTSGLFSHWLEFKSISICQRTIDWYRPTANLLAQFFADKPAIQINKLDAIAFVKFLLSNSKPTEATRRKLESLIACWNWAIDIELLAGKNPWLGLTKLIKVQPKKEPNPFTKKEVVAILKAFQDSERYCQLVPFVKLLFLTGLRTGEALGLRWSDLSRDFKTLTVRSQLTRKVRKLPKNNRVRFFKLSDEVIALFEELAKKRGSSELIFLYKGETFSDLTFRSIWTKVLKKAAVLYRNPYTTRHTFISHSLEKGLNPVYVAAICGNSSRVIYDHYAAVISSIELPSLNF